ncbi:MULTISPECIES: dihydrolipoyl dehydrogenase [unclassified Exiguobacterium]|uniref:dihydrolipoyl dehydrogenase n=1 Tax=unclassified Exiguobacterium TaxID=2644629 RepID=UPI00103A7BCB|nr:MULTISPECIES: dihydrolipoyl dehydrogenase [unclassified Exiguobacterium]TCI61383.1 dihydrolipoyl dehydrogenase [Exiguobacterium sp. SH0S2]TCI80618.1 dihydrolipoyl dehydrogenase [Exiguobacterium sp. SH0S1]
MAREFDVIVIGGGPGGYVAAIKAAQAGKHVAIVEAEKLGGTCLHKGCIPTKALLKAAHVYQTAKHGETYGVEVGTVTFNMGRAQTFKRELVSGLEKGIEHLMKQGKIEVFRGKASILGPSIFSPQPGTVAVEDETGESELLLPNQLIIATGSIPRELPGLPFDHERILNSDDLLRFEQLPTSIAIIGGGVIGVEWASMLIDLDVDVTLIEVGERLLPLEDKAVSREVERLLKKRGVRVKKNVTVDPERTTVSADDVALAVGDEQLTVDCVLVSIGRIANTEDLGLQNTSIIVENGVIQVDSQYRTKERHIFAIGDCIGKLQLAHVASAEGVKAVEAILGQEPTPLDYNVIPRCVYGVPEVASVGLTEEAAKVAGHVVKTGTYRFNGLGKARIEGQADGFVKLISDSDTDDLLGVHIVGPKATELITEGGLALVLNATAWEMGQLVHPHPALSEAFQEAALAVDGLPIHA